jgi:hypothetical protein
MISTTAYMTTVCAHMNHDLRDVTNLRRGRYRQFFIYVVSFSSELGTAECDIAQSIVC